MRASKTVSGVARAFAWDVSGALPLLLADGNDAYVYGPDGTLLERVAPDGTAAFVHADQLGSVRVLTDAGGAVVGSASWDPYGALVASSGLSLPFGFAGEYRDAESGFVYLRARYYDPATGVFLSVDPAVATTRSAYGGDPRNPGRPQRAVPRGPLRPRGGGRGQRGGGRGLRHRRHVSHKDKKKEQQREREWEDKEPPAVIGENMARVCQAARDYEGLRYWATEANAAPNREMSCRLWVRAMMERTGR